MDSDCCHSFLFCSLIFLPCVGLCVLSAGELSETSGQSSFFSLPCFCLPFSLSLSPSSSPPLPQGFSVLPILRRRLIVLAGVLLFLSLPPSLSVATCLFPLFQALMHTHTHSLSLSWVLSFLSALLPLSPAIAAFALPCRVLASLLLLPCSESCHRDARLCLPGACPALR